jgi:hypothetical protein
VHGIQSAMAREPLVWNPILKTKTPWIDLAVLHQMYRPHDSVPTSPFSTPSFHPQTSTAATTPFATSMPFYAQPPPVNPLPTMPPANVPVASVAVPAAAKASTPTGAELVTAIETTWAKQPPAFQMTKPLVELLATMPATLALVAHHEHFTPKLQQPFAVTALERGGSDVLKRAVRKIRFVLHPDRLPQDLTAEQRLWCRTLWDTISDAWDIYSSTSAQS